MWEYFPGWRRKFGLLSLFLAIICLSVWMRSHFAVDRFILNSNLRLIFVSGGGSFCVINAHSGRATVNGNKSIIAYFTPAAYLWRPSDKSSRKLDFVWYSDPVPRVELYMVSRTGTEKQIKMIPYWPVVLSPTLLSAFLLLTKPRKSKQDKTSEPLSEKAV